MGNLNIKSSESLQNLKKLYSSDIQKLDKIRLHFSNNRRIEYIDNEKNILKSLVETQNILKSSNKIPQIHLLKVDNFLNQIKSDISEYELKNIKNKSTYEGRQFDNFFNRPGDENDILETYGIDPYKLYGFNKNSKIDVNELKNKYHNFAMQTHPDKNGGNDKNFKIIQSAYKKIMEDIKLKQDDKQYKELKNNSLDFIQKQVDTNIQNTKFNKDNFDINKFNKIYQDYKISDVSDDGYKNWIDENPYDTEDIKPNVKLNSSNANFNKIFDKSVKVNNNQIQEYRDPRALFMNDKNTCSELGVDKITNFTGETNSIKYTDYKEAHTTSRLIDPDTKYKQYRNVSELENARSNIQNFTQEELEYYEQKQKMEEQQEKDRLEKQNYIDNLHFKNYERINNIMLK
tara:strand:+ start:582 stop:1787 length:1206 start_codon:yes stop_codon:yes gene_type:complete